MDELGKKKARRFSVLFEDDQLITAEAESADYYWKILFETGKVITDLPGERKPLPKFLLLK